MQLGLIEINPPSVFLISEECICVVSVDGSLVLKSAQKGQIHQSTLTTLETNKQIFKTFFHLRKKRKNEEKLLSKIYF